MASFCLLASSNDLLTGILASLHLVAGAPAYLEVVRESLRVLMHTIFLDDNLLAQLQLSLCILIVSKAQSRTLYQPLLAC